MSNRYLTLNGIPAKRAPQAWQGIFMPCHTHKAAASAFIVAETRVAGSGYEEISS